MLYEKRFTFDKIRVIMYIIIEYMIRECVYGRAYRG